MYSSENTNYAKVIYQSSGPTDIWPQRQNPTSEPPTEDQPDGVDQIFGDLQSMEPLPRNKNNPIPFVDKNKFNSLLFLARLLKTNDNLTPKDICLLQQVEPHFREIMQNITYKHCT